MTNLFFDVILLTSQETVSIEEILTDFYTSEFFKEFVSYHHFDILSIHSNVCEQLKELPTKKMLHFYITQFNCAQLTYILYGYLIGLSKEIIDKMANPKISYTKMALVFKLMEIGISQETIEREFIQEISVKNYKRILHQSLK